jgi:hypothetical protein
MPFKDDNRDLQELFRELRWLREHNHAVANEVPQRNLLFFSEACLVLLSLERFLRILPGVNPTDKDTLPTLLEKATSKRLEILRLPAKDRKDAIRRIKNVRNTILHANFEQAAKEAGCKNVGDYFRSSQFAGEVETLFKLLENLLNQVDPETGKKCP